MSLSPNDQPIDNAHGTASSEITLKEEMVDPQKTNLTWTPNQTQTKAYRKIVGVQNAGGQHKAKHLECTMRFAKSQNKGIYAIHFGSTYTIQQTNLVS